MSDESSPQNLEWETLMQLSPGFSKNTAQNLPNHAISDDGFRGHSPLSMPVPRGLHSSPQPSPLDPPLHPRSSSQTMTLWLHTKTFCILRMIIGYTYGNKCSAVGEMGDRLATIDKGRKREEGAVPLLGGAVPI